MTYQTEARIHEQATEVISSLAEENDRLKALCEELRAGAKLLLEQYDSADGYTMGGNLTNEPFLLLRAALKKAQKDI